MSSAKQTIACFGATGGCVAAALASALQAGHFCTALARTPDKLRDKLVTEHGVPQSAINQYLTIHQGDAKSTSDVVKVLADPKSKNKIVDVVLSGIGAFPTYQWSVRQPFPLTDPKICEDWIKTIYDALTDLNSSGFVGKPLIVVVSTAGCGRSRGIPLPIYLPYHYFLSSPLADKKKMEEKVLQYPKALVRDFVIMRPLILTDGEATDHDGGKLKVGWEWGLKPQDGEERVKEPGPVIGYSVSRRDVGKWTFDKVIVEGGWEGKCVYLTY